MGAGPAIFCGIQGPAGQTGPGFKATSATSVTVGTGSQALTTQTGLAYTAGTYSLALIISRGSGATMLGNVTSYSGATLVVNVTAVLSGSGSHSDWDITVTGSTGATGAQGAAGTGGIIFGNGIAINATATKYASLTGDVSTYVTTTESIAQQAIPVPITFTALYVLSTPVAGGTSSANHVFTLRKNGVDTALTVTLPSGSAPGVMVSVTGSVAFVAGDKADVKIVMGGGTAIDVHVSLGGQLISGGVSATQYSTTAGTITGTLDGENPTFTLSGSPSTLLELYVDGSRLVPTLHYTWTPGTATITFLGTSIPHSGAVIAAQGY